MIRVAIIYGGYSPEWLISEKSAKVVLANLNSESFELNLVHINWDGWFVKLANGSSAWVNRDDFSFDLNGVKHKFDIVFNAIHGTPGEDGKLAGYFDMLQIPYTSAGVMASSLTFSKSYCNGFLRQFDDINIAASVLVRKGAIIDEDSILKKVGLPCFVKPNNGGSSFGITKLTRKEDFKAALNHALEDDTEAVFEQFIDGREFGCGVYQHNGDIVALPITEIISENDFFDYQAKYEGASNEITPAEINSGLTSLIQETSREVFAQLKLKGMARVDYILQNGKPYLIEVNTIPGLSEESILPQQVVASGLTLGEFFEILVREASFSTT
jgi:D-alanine-D-alanine ligase